MVSTIIILMRWMFKLEHIITNNHLELMNKIIIATSLMVGYSYAIGAVHGLVQRRRSGSASPS